MTRRLEVVFALDSLVSGGAQRQAVELACYLRRHLEVAASVLVYSPEDFYAEKLREAGVPVILLEKRRRYDPRFPGRVREWLRAHQPDVVHAFLTRPSLWYFLGSRGLRRCSRPVFVAGERSDFSTASLLREVICRGVYRMADAVTVNSMAAAAQIEQKFSVPPERLHYLPNGIDLEEWDALSRREPPFALCGQRFHLALVGQLRPEKNHQLVLAALSELGRHRVDHWRVWFVGSQEVDPAYTSTLREEISRRGLQRIVRMVPPTREVAALMRQVDGLLLPSVFEGFPNVALEAMASGIVVIASPVGDVRRMIRDGYDGWVMSHPSASSLARHLVKLEEVGPTGRREMGARARRSVAERYSIQEIARRHLDLYTGLREARLEEGRP